MRPLPDGTSILVDAYHREQLRRAMIEAHRIGIDPHTVSYALCHLGNAAELVAALLARDSNGSRQGAALNGFFLYHLFRNLVEELAGPQRETGRVLVQLLRQVLGTYAADPEKFGRAQIGDGAGEEVLNKALRYCEDHPDAPVAAIARASGGDHKLVAEWLRIGVLPRGWPDGMI